MVAILEKRKLRDFDWLLTLLALAIALFGTWMIFHAQPDQGYWKKQLLGLGVSALVMLAVSFTDYRKLVHIAPAFYAFGLILLVLVLIPGIGLKINGQRCWIGVPGLGQFQPSEFMKVPTVLMLARYFGRPRGGPLALRQMLVGAGILALPVGLILLEPDAGQAITYFPLLAVVLFLSAIKVRWIILATLAGLILVPAAFWVGVKTGKIKQYQIERINVIVDPENADPRGYGYHTVQSMITVGKGGLTGIKGDTDSSQSVLKFLPEPHTDFIFAVTAENTGFVGCVSLLLAYALLISRMIAGARQSNERAGMLVIMSIACGMVFQIFMNVGMALGLLPVIG